MAANIRTRISTDGGFTWGSPVTGASRDDVRKGDHIECYSVDAAVSTYSWALSFKPQSAGPTSLSGDDFVGTASSASFSPDTTSRTVTFIADWDGSYLVELTVDGASTQSVRCRALTKFGDLKLAAGGERRDGTGVIPVDADAAGWADNLNQNLLRMNAFIRRTATSGRVLYVDCNRGRDSTATPNDPTNIIRIPGSDPSARDETGIRAKAEGFADFSTISDAIEYAALCTVRGEPALSSNDPYFILVKPGLYVETLSFYGFIHVVAETDMGNPTQGHVIVQTAPGGTHQYNGGLSDYVLLVGLTLQNNSLEVATMFGHFGGTLEAFRCNFYQQRVNVSLPSAFTMAGGISATFTDCNFNTQATDAASFALDLQGTDTMTLVLNRCKVRGSSGIDVNLAGSNVQHNITLLDSIVQVGNGYCFKGSPVTLLIRGSIFANDGSVECVKLAGYTSFSPAGIALSLQDSTFELGNVSVDTTGVITPHLIFDNVSLRGGSLVYPGQPGAVPLVFANTLGKSIQYAPAWVKPETNSLAVAGPNQIAANTVQDALDILVNATSILMAPDHIIFTNSPGAVDLPTDATHAGLFVSDGSGGLTVGELYFKNGLGAFYNLSAVSGGGAPTTGKYLINDSTVPISLTNAVALQALTAPISLARSDGGTDCLNFTNNIGPSAGMTFNATWTSGPAGGGDVGAIYAAYGNPGIPSAGSDLLFRTAYGGTLITTMFVNQAGIYLMNSQQGDFGHLIVNNDIGPLTFISPSFQFYYGGILWTITGAGELQSTANKKITNVANGVNPADVVVKSQLDAVQTIADAVTSSYMLYSITNQVRGTATILATTSAITVDLATAVFNGKPVMVTIQSLAGAIAAVPVLFTAEIGGGGSGILTITLVDAVAGTPVAAAANITFAFFADAN